jgi:hypothetical protein
MKIIFSVFIALFGGLLGFNFFSNQYETTEQKRNLASVKTQFDLSCLKNEELNAAVKKRILNGLKTTRRDGHLGLEIGHFVYSPNGNKGLSDCNIKSAREISSWSSADENRKLACREYPIVKLSFTSDESAENGEKKKFEVEAECQVSNDISKTEMIWIPWEKLASEKPFEGEAQFSTPSKVLVRAQNLTENWPKKWILSAIYLKGQSGEILVDQQDIKNLAGRPVVFDFP